MRKFVRKSPDSGPNIFPRIPLEVPTPASARNLSVNCAVFWILAQGIGRFRSGRWRPIWGMEEDEGAFARRRSWV